MNYYKRHLGDLAKSLSNLSQGQMGAYDLLLDWLYANEKPLPLDKREIYQIGRCSNKKERENVDRVLEYFDKGSEGYTQKRALEEIEAYARRCEVNRAQGRLGGRPKVSRGATETLTESVIQSVPKNNPSQNPEASKELLPHEGLSRTEENEGARPTPQAVNARLAIIAAAGYVNIRTPKASDPRLLAALAEGVTVAEFVDVASEAATHTPAKPWAWVIATALGRRHDAVQGTRHARSQPNPRVGLADRHPAPADDDRPVIEGKAVAVRA